MAQLKALYDMSFKQDTRLFKGTNDQIYRWVLDNFDRMKLEEAFTCSAVLENDTITITGDEDNREFIIGAPSIIKL